MKEVLLVVAGVLIKAAVDWLADTRSERRAKLQRREAFQQDALVSLQEATVALVRTVDRLVGEQATALYRSNQWLAPHEFAELSAQQLEAADRVKLCRDRIESDACRTLTDTLLRECADALLADALDRAQQQVAKSWVAWQSLSGAIGNALRDA